MRFLLTLLTLTTFSFSNSQSIAFLMDDHKSERWLEDSSVFYQQATSLGEDVHISWCYSDPDLQFRQAQKAIDSIKVKVLVLVSSHTEQNAKILEFAEQKRVPVILYDRLVQGNSKYYVSFENKEIGRIQARFMLDQVPKGNLVLVNGPTYDNNALLYREGHMEVLQPHIDKGHIQLIYDQHMAHWTDVEAFGEMSNLLATTSDTIHGIICANDGMAVGIIDALDLFWTGSYPPLTGQDGMPHALTYIRDGKQAMTVRKPIRNLATTAANLAVALAKGKEPQIASQLLQHGDFHTQFVSVGFEIVTQETLLEEESPE